MSPRSANLIPTRQQPCPTCHPLASVQCPGRQKLSHTRTPCAPFTANWAPTSAPLRIVPKPFSVTYKPTLVLTSSSNGTTSVYTPFKPLSPLFTRPTVLHLGHSLGFRNSPCSMAIRGVDFKWYDGFFLSMLATSVLLKKKKNFLVHILLLVQVDYTTVFVFRLLMFVDNGLAAGMGL
ncbi:E3 ubiquitin-protein ligase SIS3 [Vitis vinifera]|uniref:E3 ubiquitin-protein ligase SIS3 n=1 Tax=Vitis vinifera TaxID=29760 RepID=A0A438EYV9_VITVI|nr:E3 ubiquitin-protein ligase SIS3 [Vitis vinifera]